MWGKPFCPLPNVVDFFFCLALVYNLVFIYLSEKNPIWFDYYLLKLFKRWLQRIFFWCMKIFFCQNKNVSYSDWSVSYYEKKSEYCPLVGSRIKPQSCKKIKMIRSVCSAKDIKIKWSSGIVFKNLRQQYQAMSQGLWYP